MIHEQQQHLLTRTAQETETKVQYAFMSDSTRKINLCLDQALQIELKECRHQLTNQTHAKDGAEMKMSNLLEETDAIKQQLERSNTEMCVMI